MSLEHRARKRFGQNFLEDESVIRRIVKTISPQPDDTLVEIGPGKGALTQHLLQGCPDLQVIELDRDLVPLLLARFISRYPRFTVHQKDALDFDFRQLLKSEHTSLRVVGNLPYNISTALIFHLLQQHPIIQDMHFMLQREVVERLAAPAGIKAYGRLSVMAQYHCRVEHLFDVAPECFSPAPKVQSAIVKLVPHQQPPCIARDLSHLHNVVTTAFQQRRKTLRNALKTLLDSEQIESLNIDPGSRPEQITLAQFVALSNLLSEV